MKKLTSKLKNNILNEKLSTLFGLVVIVSGITLIAFKQIDLPALTSITGVGLFFVFGKDKYIGLNK